jgi:hypothetical protein
VFRKLPKGLENLVAQPSAAEGKQDLHVDQVIAWYGFPKVDHIEIAERLPSPRMDLEGVKGMRVFLGLETFDFRSMDRPSD